MIKKLMLISLTGFSLTTLSGCASSSFHEYFNEPVSVVEKSVTPNHVTEVQEDKVSSKVEKDNSVETYPIEEVK